MYKILVTGDRNWDDSKLRVKLEHWFRHILEQQNLSPEQVSVIHGGCRGVDLVAKEIANNLGIRDIPFPAEWDKYRHLANPGRRGNPAGPIRNQAMIDYGPSLVLAFHPNIAKSRGTKDCLERAQKAGIPTYLINGN